MRTRGGRNGCGSSDLFADVQVQEGTTKYDCGQKLLSLGVRKRLGHTVPKRSSVCSTMEARNGLGPHSSCGAWTAKPTVAHDRRKKADQQLMFLAGALLGCSGWNQNHQLSSVLLFGASSFAF